jgi:predicted porin
MKKALALAIAAAVAAPMAVSAEVVIYGKAHVSIDGRDVGDKDFDNALDDMVVSSRASRLGFKGSEDLGNGLKAIFQYEMTYSGLDGPGQVTPSGVGSARNSYIGLAGGFGTFLVGRHDTPTKVAYYAAKVEELGDSILDLNTGGTGDGLGNSRDTSGLFREFRANNAIAYISPSFGGFTFAGAAVPGESGAPCGEECDGIADHWSVAAMYGGFGLNASIGYESKLLSSDPGADEEDILQVGASYTLFDSLKLGGMYQDISNYGSSDNDADAWAVTVSWMLGNNKLIGQYGAGEVDDYVEKDTWGLGVEHVFSKRTSAYIAYANGEWDYDDGRDADADEYSFGMIHKF